MRINKICNVQKITDVQNDDYVVVFEDSIYIVNGTGGEIFHVLLEMGEYTEEEIIAYICNEYNVEKKTAEKDVREFLSEFVKKGIILL